MSATCLNPFCSIPNNLIFVRKLLQAQIAFYFSYFIVHLSGNKFEMCNCTYLVFHKWKPNAMSNNLQYTYANKMMENNVCCYVHFCAILYLMRWDMCVINIISNRSHKKDMNTVWNAYCTYTCIAHSYMNRGEECICVRKRLIQLIFYWKALLIRKHRWFIYLHIQYNIYYRGVTSMRQRRQLPPHYLALLKITFGLASNRLFQPRKITFAWKPALSQGTLWTLENFINLPRLTLTLINNIIKFIITAQCAYLLM